MLGKQDKIAKLKGWGIVIGGLITSIALALGLEKQVAQLVHLEGSTSLDLNSCLSKNLVKLTNLNVFCLMINNEVIKTIMLSNSELTNVHANRNWLYPIEASTSSDNHHCHPSPIFVIYLFFCRSHLPPLQHH